jgi:vancomycin permeability regulator SanA
VARRSTAGTAATVCARGLALFFGAFGVLNAAASLRGRGFGENVLWVDPRPLPEWLGQPLIGVAAVLLLAWAFRPRCAAWRGWATTAAAVVLAAVALWNVAAFYWAMASGVIEPQVPLPLSLVVFGLMLWLCWMVRRPSPRRASAAAALGVAAVAACAALLFPLGLMLFFGTTRYEQPSQAAVVLGAQVFRDGTLSPSLADRVRTGANLFLDGLAPLLVVSGGRGDGGRHECDAMRSYAEELGVPAQAIVEDRRGVTTQATVDDTVVLFRRDGIRRVLVISQFYHLPRIKMAYQRAGIDVRTVPARADHFIKQTPLIMAREIPAFWLYYLRGLVS